MNKLNGSLSIIILVLIGIIFLQRACYKKPCTPTVTQIVIRDTISLRDTVFDFVPIPTVVSVTKTKRDTIYIRKDTSHAVVQVPQTVPVVINQSENWVYYADTVKSKLYGRVIINDTIRQNRIAKRNVIFDLRIPTTTVIQTEKKTILYGGIDVLGTDSRWITYMGPALTLKTKRDQLYEAKVLFGPEKKPMYGVGVKFKISLKK